MILYIDPSVMTYLVQAIAGVVIAVVAFFGIYYRKAKKKVSDKLGIDENRNKEVESDEIVIKNEKIDDTDVIVEKPEEKKKVKKTSSKNTSTSSAKKTTTKKSNSSKTTKSKSKSKK